MEEDESLELDDGTETPSEDQGLETDNAAQFAINPAGTVTFEFKEGNYSQLASLPTTITQFVESFSRTLLPIVESCMVELLGNSNAYERIKCETTFSMAENKPRIVGSLTYGVELWIGDDIDSNAIAQDAKFVYDRLMKIPNISISSCKIDCHDGTLNVEFTLGT